MRRSWQAMAAASAFAAAVLTVSTLFAASAADKGERMMGRGGMGSMGQMMDHCSRMMGGGSTRPNEQWKRSTPPDKSTPDRKS